MDEALLKRIANHQMLHGSFHRDLGLLHGKMGLVLFFFHYARHTGKGLYDDFAGELLDEIYEEIHFDMSICFGDGLCGIGWALTYLVEQEFVEGDIEEILRDVDKMIMERNPKRMSDHSLESGLEGISYYVLSRLSSSGIHAQLFDATYLNELEEAYLTSWRSANVYSNRVILNRIIENDHSIEFLSWKEGLKILLK